MNDIDMKEVGARIRQFRTALGLNQSELAARLGGGCTQSRVSSWENGRVRPEEYIDRLCTELGVTAEQIWYGKRYSSGGEEVRNEELKKVLRSAEWSQLPAAKKQALAALLNDVDVADYEVKSIMAVLLRGSKDRRPRTT